MSDVTTLRQISGLPARPATWGQAALVMIDCQRTYTTGVMRLEGVEAALDEATALLEAARSANTPVIHIQHDSGEGTPYDVRTDIGQIVEQVAPHGDEPVITKSFPNAFVQTSLENVLRGTGRENVILAGFMTHMCVNSTARGAFNLGFGCTVVASATATRNLPVGDRVVDAAQIQAASLAAIGDLFAVVAPDAASIHRS